MFFQIILFLLSTKFLAAEFNEDKSNTYDGDNFFSFGQKKVLKDVSAKLQNSILKSKVDALGEILKKRVDLLRNAEKNHPLELVFLVDASSSVGAENFESELKFVKKLLADFTISSNQTRVAIVSFASPNDVIRQVDHLNVTDTTLNKCSLMNKHINYSGGGTYTLGAMLEAKKLFSNSRTDAHCALFLVTDGFSNGGDPRPIAKELRDAGVTIFTFGISTGNRAELYEMSSVPGHEHSFLLDSFAEFEALARRALHEDLAVGYYVNVEDQKLCEPECSAEASCACGLRTGHYSCLCPPGFYGSGLFNTTEPACTICPNGTYHNGLVPGDVTVCIPCPDVNHVTYGPAKSPKDCFCGQGFKPSKNGKKCEMIHCPDLDIPENGYMVHGWCSTVMNAGCGIRCNVGYSLVGSSVRLCLPNGTWSGVPPQCIMKRCPRLQPPQNGNISCNPDDGEEDLPLDTECQATCHNGFTLIGSTKRTCLPLTKWDGIPNKCRTIHCRALPTITNGFYDHDYCTTIKRHEFGTVCKIQCYPGYELNGPDIRECIGKGTWTNKRELTSCIDNTPPELQCPDDLTVNTVPEEGYAWVSWTEPQPQDNSNQSVIIWTLPATEQPMKVGIGKIVVTYVATDSSFNQATCNFTIDVVDKESPVVSNCDSDEEYTVLVNELSDIKWLEPEFHDNSGESVKVITSHKLEDLPLGTTNVTYTASDSSGNNSTCSLLITVIEDSCEQPKDPLNGSLNCTDDDLEIGFITCTVNCDVGYTVSTDNNTFKYNCDSNFTSLEDYNSTLSSFVPECMEVELPNSIMQEGAVSFETNSPDWCSSSDFINQVATAVQNHLETLCLDSSCKVNKKVAIECENALSNIEEETNKILGRKRRELQKTKVNIKFALEEKMDIQNSMQNTAKLNLLSRLTRDEVFSKTGLSPTKNLNIVWKNEWPICSTSFIPKKHNMCVKCPAGTAWSNDNKCIPCSLGWYQPLAGQEQCIKCPDFTSTRKTNARNIRACKSICPPGTYSRNRKEKGQIWKPGDVGVIPCVSCPIGTYQSESGSIKCINCKSNFTTKHRGSVSSNKCIALADQIHCQNMTCRNGGLCKIYKEQVMCSCPKDFLGSHCETKLDMCLSKPCLHGGICHSNDFGYNCTCPNGFTGTNCQDEIDECSLNPCKNSGECIDLINDFHCYCPPMFYGVLCEIKLDECETQPCADGAQCINNPSGGYHCQCSSDYSGRQCEVSPCQMRPNICRNNATCQSSFNDTHQFYRCECDHGWSGQFCDIQINPCDSNPCMNSGSCTFDFESKSFSCLCQPGYYGNTCETYISPDFALYFPSAGTLNYVKVKGPTSVMLEFSLCMWVQSSFIGNYGTLFSYATIYHDNTITLTDYNGLVFYVNGEKVITDIRVNDGIWHSVCVEWQANGGSWNIYLDGHLEQTGAGLSNNSIIPAQGVIIIGQDQDRIGGGFNPAEALVGYVAGVDLWNYKIDEYGALKHAEECNNVNNTVIGNVLSWVQLRNALYGNIQIDVSPLCKGCSSPFTPQHSNLKLLNSGKVAVYTCDEGYVFDMRGRKSLIQKRRCLKDGSWQGNAPVCQRCYCGYPGYFPHGKIKGNSYYYSDNISYKCDSGYKLVGSLERQCLADGSWSGEQPSCQAEKCPSIAVPRYCNMWMVVGDSYHMEFECISGYIMKGNALLTCLDNGLWDNEPPSCEPVNCTQPLLFDDFIPELKVYHSNDDIVHYPVGSVVKYVCKSGFISNNNYSNVIATCKLNGLWEISRVDVECIKNHTCSPILKVEHGVVVTSSKLFNVGTQVNITCDPGFKLNGSSQRTCLDNSLWSGNESTCSRMSCPSLRTIINITSDIILNEDNLTYGSVAALTCPHEFQLTVNKEALDYISWICSRDGKWEGDVNISNINLSCLEKIESKCSVTEVPLYIDTSLLPNDTILYPVGSILKIHCQHGYELKGQNDITCLENGSWSSVNKTICHAVECPKPPQPSNSEIVSLESLKYGSSAVFKCKPGYQEVGIFSVVCQANRRWSRFRGKCLRLSCNKPDVHPEAVVEGNSYLFEDQVKIICPPGTVIQGNQFAICQGNGKWSELPKCL